MPADWPSTDEPLFVEIVDDLKPLIVAYPPPDFDPENSPDDEASRAITLSRLRLPDELFSVPLTNDVAAAVPWEYVVDTAPVNLRGEVVAEKRITIRGVTLVHGPEDQRVFRRYVDWAGVWAQLGVSTGRGEAGDDQRFLAPNGEQLRGS